jgi:two-component system OmpR family response regulator
LTREQLLGLAWGDNHDVASNVVDVYVRYLRAKIDRPFGVNTLHTVRGVGYRLTAETP